MKVLLFDVLSTLVHDPYFVEAPAFFGLSLEDLHRLKHPTAWVEFELGRLDEGQLFRRFFADGRPIDGEALKACFRGAYRWLDGMEELLADLAAAGCEMHAVSNYPLWYQLIEERLGLGRYLEWSFVSCHTGRRKPDPEVFRHAARTLGRRPAECLFIDDRSENCAAAEAVGMEAVLFKGAEPLRREFERRGLSSEVLAT